MKKYTTLFVLALFLVSLLPATLAQGPVMANRDRASVANKVLSEQDLKKPAAMLKEQCLKQGFSEKECDEKARVLLRQGEKVLKNKAVGRFKALREKRLKMLKELKQDKFLSKIDKAKNFRARLIAKNKLLKAKANLLKAKERFIESKAKLEKARQRFEKAKALMVCKEDPESDDCANAKEELKASAKEKLLTQAEIIEGLLNKALSQAESNEALTDEEAERIIGFINDKLERLSQIKQDIESADDKEGLVKAARELGALWRDMKHKTYAFIGRMVNARQSGIIVKAAHLEAKLERVLERMSDNGKDTSEIEPLVEDFKSKIDLAKEKFEDAQEKFVSVSEDDTLTDEEKRGLFDSAKELMKESRDALKDANSLLRDIFKKLKEANGLEELSQDNDEESEETSVDEETSSDESEETSVDEETSSDESEETSVDEETSSDESEETDVTS